MKLYIYFILLSCALLSCKAHQTDPAYISEIENHREAYKADFLKQERTPLEEADLPFLDFFAPDDRYNCSCSVQLKPDAQPFKMATYAGKTKDYRVYAEITCPFPDGKQKFEIYQNLQFLNLPIYQDHLFLPFMDASNGETTYGGGRYIDLNKSAIENGKVEIDFNKCYNPWCAYSDGFNCPVPPIANHKDIVIPVGEKAYKGNKKKLS